MPVGNGRCLKTDDKMRVGSKITFSPAGDEEPVIGKGNTDMSGHKVDVQLLKLSPLVNYDVYHWGRGVCISLCKVSYL